MDWPSKKCIIPGCEMRAIKGKTGMCSSHYFAQYGKDKGECSAPGCTKPQYSRGYCSGHYQRLRQGAVGNELTKPLMAMHYHHGEACEVKGCNRPAAKGTLCSFHYTRKMHGINLEKPTKSNSRPRLRTCTYRNAHLRLRTDRGPACLYKCADCGCQARDWSYQYGAPDERSDEHGYLYSTIQSYYVPRCRSCNLAHDKRHRDSTIKESS